MNQGESTDWKGTAVTVFCFMAVVSGVLTGLLETAYLWNVHVSPIDTVSWDGWDARGWKGIVWAYSVTVINVWYGGEIYLEHA